MAKTYDEIMELVGRTAEVTHENSENMSQLLHRIDNQSRLLGGLAKSVTNIEGQVTDLGSEIEQLKLNEEVTTTQQEMLIETAQRRVCEILGNDPLEREKYFRIFIKRLYKDTRQNAGLGSKVSRTKKGDYQRCIDFMESWIPSCGCAELRSKADAYANARIEATKLGYKKPTKRIRKTYNSDALD